MGALKFLFLFAVSSVGLAVVFGQGNQALMFNSPCWEKPCHTFATCKVFNRTEAICVCPKNCTISRNPVCGTNWKTYDNLCSLMAESCAMNDWNSLRYNGPCNLGDCRNSIFQNMNCPWFSGCRLHYGFPRCVCPPEECSMKYEPLCATDGRTYRNLCHMRKAGCQKRKLLRVRNAGHCKPDPCKTHSCCCGAVCRVNETNYASCSCDFTCSQQSNPVCGSDGKTFNSPCDLRLAACREQNMKLTQVSNGPCNGPGTTSSPGTQSASPCAHQICSFHATCIVEGGLAKCVCPVCSVTRTPVCGSNGMTYDNECLLKRASCVSMVTITKLRDGSCGSTVEPTKVANNPCKMGQCAHYGTCVVFRGVPTCICPDLCPQIVSPVCGSDGVTYENDCAMRRASCKSEKPITVLRRGPCDVKPTVEPVKPTMDPCFDQTCTYHAECIVDQGLPMCACPSNCPNTSSPVCGSDGVTYENECAMKSTSCNKQLTINIASRGRCPSKCDTTKCCCGSVCRMRNNTATCLCDFMCSPQYDPVCGNDGKTYGNQCELRLTACEEKNPNLRLASRGLCPTVAPTSNPCASGMCAYHATCQVVQGQARCVCPELCPSVFSPKCGSDGRTYQNDCSMKRESCIQQVTISVAKNGPCGTTPTQGGPCAFKICQHFSSCEVVQGVAKCVCPDLCPEDLLEVCGSDGKTYENECALERTSCLAGRMIDIIRIGVCLRTLPQVAQVTTPRVQPTVKPTANNLCSSGRCAYYAICEVYQGQPRCSCPSPCTGPKTPVCGSDGRTYDSECDLKRSSCTSQTKITVVKPGFCEPIGRCPTPKQCNKECVPEICALSGQICCCQGCAKACTTVVWSRGRYVCPEDPLGCRNDSDCHGGLICCYTGCTKQCTAPRQ